MSSFRSLTNIDNEFNLQMCQSYMKYFGQPSCCQAGTAKRLSAV